MVGTDLVDDCRKCIHTQFWFSWPTPNSFSQIVNLLIVIL